MSGNQVAVAENTAAVVSGVDPDRTFFAAPSSRLASAALDADTAITWYSNHSTTSKRNFSDGERIGRKGGSRHDDESGKKQPSDSSASKADEVSAD